ncbi:hypothetical protein MFFC18_17820 [Mariniblastus fucicola]|uniref:Uncharacterized protein n=1 Tax=Mariniblastus fucicola TaxID=980251 RepID=A0A5B9PGA6_9BACT|nr:hypothetical protein MFFC18_17820 [Mariniblastus fucicola]
MALQSDENDASLPTSYDYLHGNPAILEFGVISNEARKIPQLDT